MNLYNRISVLFFGMSIILMPSLGSMDFATQGAQMLERIYVADCQTQTQPHGFYGAFFQPCEFRFYQQQRETTDLLSIITKDDNSISSPEMQDTTTDANAAVCTDPSSTLLTKPVPMHWFFNLTDHYQKDDWDSMDWDDDQDNWNEIAEKLLLWPDQCVGVMPRCYDIQDPAIIHVLYRLFSTFDNNTKIPMEATHVQVNCQADALALSRVVYTVADGFQKSVPTLIAWMVMVVVLAIVALAWCGYLCFRLCCTSSPQHHHHTKPATYVLKPATPSRRWTSNGYSAIETMGNDDENEKLIQMKLMAVTE